jgi:hypothetical protein
MPGKLASISVAKAPMRLRSLHTFGHFALGGVGLVDVDAGAGVGEALAHGVPFYGLICMVSGMAKKVLLGADGDKCEGVVGDISPINK